MKNLQFMSLFKHDLLSTGNLIAEVMSEILPKVMSCIV